MCLKHVRSPDNPTEIRRCGFPRNSASATQSEFRRSVPARSWHMETTVTRQQPTIMETTILICIHLPEYGIRQATTTLWTSYKIVTVDPQKFGITEIRRCRNSGVSDVKSANAACGESIIDTYVTKIESEILYIRNNLSVVFACYKTVWVSHGASPNNSVVRLRLTFQNYTCYQVNYPLWRHRCYPNCTLWRHINASQLDHALSTWTQCLFTSTRKQPPRGLDIL